MLFFQLESILSAQVLHSADGGKLTPIHDEHLFIVTHQSKPLVTSCAVQCNVYIYIRFSIICSAAIFLWYLKRTYKFCEAPSLML